MRCSMTSDITSSSSAIPYPCRLAGITGVDGDRRGVEINQVQLLASMRVVAHVAGPTERADMRVVQILISSAKIGVGCWAVIGIRGVVVTLEAHLQAAGLLSIHEHGGVVRAPVEDVQSR